MRSRSQGKAELSVEEIVALLNRTALPTIVVEGSDDMIVYRRFEERLSQLGISVFPVGGRQKVLDAFARRSEISSSVKVAFIVDQDTWINTGIPAQFQCPQLIFTFGYSLENDVFADGNFLSLLTDQERAKFTLDLQRFVEWYSLALARHLQDSVNSIALHPDHVLDDAQRPGLMQLKDDEQYPEALRLQILGDYQRCLRGKSLLALLVRNTNYKGRQPRHTIGALLEMVAVRPGPNLQRMSAEVEAIIAAPVEGKAEVESS